MKIAHNAQEALYKLENGFSPDMIIVDLDMPVMDGFSFIDVIQEKNLAPQSAITILTNKNEPYYVEKARHHHIDLYIVKATQLPSQVMDSVISLLTKRLQKAQ